MSWIESHQEIAQHPKTRRLARYLGVSIPDAIGRLHLLWWWAMNYAEDGDLSEFTPEEIATATLWDGEATLMIDSLVATDWVDRSGRIHDWCGGHPSRKVGSAVRAAWESMAKRIRPIIFARDGYRCVFCGASKPLHVDHAVSIANGGTNDLENLQTLCAPCNWRKGAS